MPIELTDRQRRLIDAALILAVIALGFVVVSDLASVFAFFGDILLMFFLAWLLSFALLPVINAITKVFPRLPTAGAVIIVYLAIVFILVGLLIQVSASLATSIGQFVKDTRFEDALVTVLKDIQGRLAGIGFRVDLVKQAPEIVANLQDIGNQLIGPLQSFAFASIGVLGNILILVILSIYIAVDRESITAFLYRLVPPGFVTEARLLQTSVAKSFGGFIRGQLVMGLAMGAITSVVNVVFGLEYGVVTAILAGVLHAIPFFGPFVSWLPPVAVALLFSPEAVIPVLIIMAIGWFVTMNILQPRLMAGAVGIHPIVVLGSVVVGLRIAGIPGAIFGIPIAAVISAFFFHWYGRSRENTSVADRAAKRLAAREQRAVRRPREPVPGLDIDVDEVHGGRGFTQAHEVAHDHDGSTHTHDGAEATGSGVVAERDTPPTAGASLSAAADGTTTPISGEAASAESPAAERLSAAVPDPSPASAATLPTATSAAGTPSPDAPAAPASPAPPPESLGGEGER